MTTVFRPGMENPLRCMAVVTRSKDSRTHKEPLSLISEQLTVAR